VSPTESRPLSPPAGGDESAYYLPDGRDRVVPTMLTQGPWDPNAQHGGPVCGLLAWAAETPPTLVPMQLSRITVDLWRPVPLRPLRIERCVRREGKRLQAVDVSLFDGEIEVAHAGALRIRRGDTSDPDIVEHPLRPQVASPLPPGSVDAVFTGPGAERVGFIRSIDAYRVVGRTGEGAPAVMWLRMRQPLIAGEPTPPAATVALASDFASALAAYIDVARWSYINPDVNVHLLREPTSDWIAVDGVTWVGREGIGHGRANLSDLEGFIGSATTTQLVDRHRMQPPHWSTPVVPTGAGGPSDPATTSPPSLSASAEEQLAREDLRSTASWTY
jgi:hypothetical protein